MHPQPGSGPLPGSQRPSSGCGKKTTSRMHLRNRSTLCILILACSIGLKAQTRLDSLGSPLHVSGNIGLTNNGISIVPTFSLNAPATNLIFSVRKGRFSFDPDIRLTLDARKGGMLFWFRYRLVEGRRFGMSAGVHPAYNLATRTITVNGKASEITQARRFFAYELAPSLRISKHLAISPYYLRGMGLQPDGPLVMQFVALNAALTNLEVSNELRLSVAPQFYYLYLDGKEGLYLASNLRLSHPASGLYLQSTLNKEIRSRIPGSRDFMWNLSVFWSFSHDYRRN